MEELLLKMIPPSKRINQFKEESIPRKLMPRSDIEKKHIYNKKKSIVKFFQLLPSVCNLYNYGSLDILTVYAFLNLGLANLTGIL